MTTHLEKAQGSGKVVALPPGQLPFETWRPIFQIVYATNTAISHPPSDFEISNLNARLNIYRCLAQVSRSWRANARDVFFENLEALTADALKGLIRTFQNDRSLALVVSRISFCFEEFRFTASTPRRPRPFRRDANYRASSSAPDGKTIHERDAREYKPSPPGAHWTRWQADVGQILAMCTSLSEADVISTIQSYTIQDRDRRYLERFPPPDLTNENILNGLLLSTNLRSLRLVDPTPLSPYGSVLASWEHLKHLAIVLTRKSEDLKDTTFVPPKSLISFCFQDIHGNIPWPLRWSGLARCTNLQVLNLGLTSKVATEATCKAIGFLCMAYQHSLRELTLHVFHGDRSLQDIFESVAPLYFSKLQRLRLPEAAYDTQVFTYFKADALTYVEVGWLLLEPTTGSREDKWSRVLNYASLRMLKELVINQVDPDNHRKQALYAVCERMGITLIFRSFVETGFPIDRGGGAFEIHHS